MIKYKIKDYAEGELLGPLASNDTSITLKGGHGARFPSVSNANNDKAIATLVHLDSNGAIVKKERVVITNRNGDVITVTRGHGGDVAVSFAADDKLSLFINADVIKDIQDQAQTNASGITDLGDSKLDKNGQLRGGLESDRIVRTDAQGKESYLAKGVTGKYLKHDFTRGSPPMDVASQTETTSIATNDFVLIQDSSDSNKTKKIKMDKVLAPTASTTTKGLVERATDTEASTGTDTTRYVTPKQIHSNLGIKSKTISQNIEVYDSNGTFTLTNPCGTIPMCIIFSDTNRDLDVSAWSKEGSNMTQRIRCNGQYHDGCVAYNNSSQGDYAYFYISNITNTQITMTRNRLSGSWGNFVETVFLTFIYQ